MAAPTLHVHFRRTGSDEAPACPVHYDEASDRLLIDCSALSPDLADLEARHQGDRYILKNPHLTIPVTMTEDAERFVFLESTEESTEFYPRVITSEAKANAYLAELRRPEVTRPGGHGPGKPLGTIIEADFGVHGSVGEETAPFTQSTIREIRAEGESNAFTGAGITWALRLRTPRQTWLRWFSPLLVSAQGAWTKGTVGDHYTGRSGEEGNWETWCAGLFLGVQLDAQFFAAVTADVLLPWNLYLRYETPAYAYREFNAFAALNGRALAEDLGFTDTISFFDQHLATAGFTYCVGQGLCLGLGGFFRQYAIDHGEIHFLGRDFGAVFTMDFLNPTRAGRQLPDDVGDTRVTFNPLPVHFIPAPPPEPKVVADAPPPAPLPEPRPVPTEEEIPLPAKREFTFSGGTPFAEGSAALTTATSRVIQRCLKQKSAEECKTGVQLCEELTQNIGEWFRLIVDEDGFPENQKVGGVFEGHTNSNGSEKANQGLSNKRAASVEKCVVGKMATGNAAAKAADSALPYPPNFTAMHRGYGETQLVMGSDGKEDMAASRRVVVRIASDLAELQKVAPTVEPTQETIQGDAAVATQIVKMAKSKGPITMAFHHAASNTIYAVVPVAYPGPGESLGTKKTFFNAVQRAVKGQLANLRKLSPSASFEILLQPTPPSMNDAVSTERINEAKAILQPFSADSFVRDIHEIPTDTTPEEYADQLTMHGGTEIKTDEARWNTLIDPKNAQQVMVDGQEVTVYTLVPTFEKHLPDGVTRTLLQAFAQRIVGKEKAGYARLYYGPSAKMFDAKKTMVVIGHALQDPLKNMIGNVRHVPVDDDPDLPPRLLLVVAPKAVTDLEALRKALFDQVIAPQKK